MELIRTNQSSFRCSVVPLASIRKRRLPSGKIAWLVDFSDTNGCRRAKQFPTRKEADAFMVSARAAVSQGTYIHEHDSLTIRVAAGRWLESCKVRRDAGRRMEPATYRDYEGKVRLHILDENLHLADRKLASLRRRDINAFRDALLSSGRSEGQTRKVLSVLSLLLSHAEDDGLIAGNPAKGVRLIRASRIQKKVTLPAKAEISALIDRASHHFQPMLLVASLCGLRASELRGLVWENVDLNESWIHVRQRADAYNIIGEPKSAAGMRSVPMGPMVRNHLKRWQLACPLSKLGLVFPTRDGTIQSHSNILQRQFKPLCRELGIKMRWHDLRHFAISLWIEQGFSLKEVMTFAGHSTVQMTMDLYGHLFPSPEHHDAMAAVERNLLG